MVQPDHSQSGVWRLLTSRLPKGDTVTLQSISKMPIPYTCFLYDQTRSYCRHWSDTYGDCLFDPVGDIMHIQEGILPFIQNGGSFTS